jgi:hypothetical protein
VRNDLGIHARFTHPSGNQLGILSPEVDNENRARSAHFVAFAAAFDFAFGAAFNFAAC